MKILTEEEMKTADDFAVRDSHEALRTQLEALRAVEKAARDWQEGIHRAVHGVWCTSPLCKALADLNATRAVGSK